jgi:hypothetical protein
MSIIIPGLLSIRPQYTQEAADSDRPENVLWWLMNYTGGYSSSQLQDVAEKFDALWINVWGDQASENAYYLGSIIQDYTAAEGLQYSSVGTYTPVAGGSGASTAPQAAGLISLKGYERYRGGHGRVYLPYVGAAALSANQWLFTDATTTATQGALNTLITTMGTDTDEWKEGQWGVLRHRKTAPALELIYTALFQSVIATQRRRVRKVPHH